MNHSAQRTIEDDIIRVIPFRPETWQAGRYHCRTLSSEIAEEMKTEDQLRAASREPKGVKEMENAEN